MKTMRLKNRYCPWMNRDIINLMYKRDYLHKKAVRSKCLNIWNLYKSTRNRVTSMIRIAKRHLFENELCNVSNSKQFWKKINVITGKNVVDAVPKTITSHEFNDYFAGIGHSVVNDDIRRGTNQPLVWKNPPCVHKFKFKHCCISDGCDSSVDVLGFDLKLLAFSCETIAPIITKIVNASFLCSKLPHDWKFSRVTPVYKGKGSRDDLNNYRPISVITHVAKIAEKVVQKQLLHYLLSNDLIVADQSAYRPQHNTQTALHRVVDSWIDNVCDGLLTGVCFLDIRKCFDTINHELLKEKLSYYGVTGAEYGWFSDYLNNRCQVVFHNQELSNKNDVTIGVPQGSVLGPTLFMLFINDISQSSNVGVCNLYADDTIVYCQGNSVNEVQEKLQVCVSQLNGWYKNNKLSVNTSKSEVMVITSKRKIIADDLDNEIDGVILNYVECANYLGMKIDCHLSWNEYVNKLCANVAAKLGKLRRLKDIISSQILYKIYITAVQPCIDYAISVWGQTNEYNIYKIQRLQNFAARLITNNFDYVNCRGIELVKMLKWMNVKERCQYFTINLMFKCIHGLAPSYLANNVTMKFDVNGINTRSHPMDVYIPYVSSQLGERSFQYIGAKLWNMLPSSLKDVYDFNDFKFKLRNFILN